MAINFISGDEVVVSYAFAINTLATLTFPFVDQTTTGLGYLANKPCQVLSTGYVAVSGSILSHITLLPASRLNPAYNGGAGIILYFPDDTLLNNSFELATAFLEDTISDLALNLSGSIIPKYSLVRQTGFNVTQQLPTVGLASAASLLTSTVIGIALEDIGIGSTGTVLVEGSCQGIDTSLFALGGSVFLSDTPGAISTAPGTVSEEVAKVTTVGVTGAVFIRGVNSSGSKGSTGVNGVTGLVGFTGIQGNTGIQGDTGIIGITGLIGFTGIQGNTGIQGDTGIAGITGLGYNSPWVDVATVVQLVTSTNSVVVQSGKISSPGTTGISCEQFGLGAAAIGTNALAVGPSATADGFQGIAMGYQAQTIGYTGIGKIAIGWNAISEGDRTIAIGENARASVDESVAIGPDAWANNNRGGGSSEFPSTSVGDGCKAGPRIDTTGITGRQAWLAAYGAYSEAGLGAGNNSDCIAIGDSCSAGGTASADLQTYADCVAIGNTSVAGYNGAVFTIKTAANLTGATFTITINGVPTTLTDGVDFVHSSSNSTESTNLRNAINASAALIPYITASRSTYANGWYILTIKLLSALTSATTLTVSTSAAAGDATAADPYASADCISIGNNNQARGTSDCIALGDSNKAGLTTGHTDCIAIGRRVSTGGTNAIVMGKGLSGGAGPASNADSTGVFINNSFVCGSSNYPITDIWFGSGPGGSGSSLANTGYTIHGPEGRTGFPNGATVTIAGGRGLTATDIASSIHLQTGQTGVASTLLNRMIVNSVAKSLTSTVASGLIRISLASGTMAGGRIKWVIRATDGVDFQSISGLTTFAGVNKAGVITSTATNNATNDALAVSAGTLTTAWSTSAGAGTVDIQVTATTSLTTTTFDIQYQVENDSTVDLTIL